MLNWLTRRRQGRQPEPLSSWFTVRWDDTAVDLDVRPPGRDGWRAPMQWEAFTRLCFKAEGHPFSDGIYIFTRDRAESYAIPMDGGGGHEFWDELVRRGLFIAHLAATALTAVDGVFCWLGLDAPDQGAAQQCVEADKSHMARWVRLAAYPVLGALRERER